ncbi:hypothetical protein [Actinocrispum wychmicini]|uniref:Type VII secretion system (Wss) protein ESAT-6 n=1 Tax=Actinocrispum wychmicini TaxID=1213861 RepID=A0A4R2JME0_9PSEU|nr:hypothetical protein [Actinocrispum wychmicini]TCO58286.1 hypothetical protein EV192_105351 [Actinocrispum wychmicini]
MTDPKPSIADRLGVTRYDESFGANVERAVESTPVVGNAYKTGKSIAEHAQDLATADDMSDLTSAAGHLLGDGAKFVGTAAMEATTFIMDPIGWLVSHGLNMLLELVHPLQDALHQVTGDGPAIGHASANFTSIAQGFVALADDFQKQGDTSLKDWQDQAGDEARQALAEFSNGIRGVGSSAGSVAEVLQMWSMVMVVIEEVIKAIISELVSWLITIWLPALATSVISFGSSVAAAMTASIAKAAAVFKKVTKYLGMFGKLLDKFVEYLQKYADKLITFANKLRVGKVVEKGEKTLPVIGKVADHKMYIPSRRVLTTGLGTASGAGPLVTGAGIKAGIGAGKGAGKEAYEDARDGRMLDESDIGGGRTTGETHKNLDM